MPDPRLKRCFASPKVRHPHAPFRLLVLRARVSVTLLPFCIAYSPGLGQLARRREVRDEAIEQEKEAKVEGLWWSPLPTHVRSLISR